MSLESSSLGSRIYRGVLGFFNDAFFGPTVQGTFLGPMDERSHLIWIGPVVGMVVGFLLGATIGHWEFRGRTRRVTLGIFAGFIVGLCVGGVIDVKCPAVDEEERYLHIDEGIRFGAIFGPLLGGVIGARWKADATRRIHK